MSLPMVYQYPSESAFACSIDIPNGAKMDFMKSGVVNMWLPCDSVEHFTEHPGFVGLIFESVEYYNEFTRNPQEKCWSYRGGLQCCTHFRSGLGQMRWNDGDVYQGEFSVNSMDGRGIYTFKDGRKYIGEFDSDEPHGQGTVTWPDGTSFTGSFFEGKFDVSKPCNIVFKDGKMCEKKRLDADLKCKWDGIHDYYIWDMGKAEPVNLESKTISGIYWKESQITQIKFEKKEEANSDSDSDSDEEEKEEPLHPNVTVREKQPRTFTRAEDNEPENLHHQICGGCNKMLLEEEQMLCSGCEVQHYCSTECQKVHWKTHKKICKNLE
uniref:MYND-type domain-containing protein n=1 Tax=viral metagenome TaxID=1070528 RepID=A0A6C0B0R1_9ZZZZ